MRTDVEVGGGQLGEGEGGKRVDEGRETAKADGDGGGRRAALITVLYYKN